MQGHYHKRSSTWSYNGVNPQTGKRKQKRKGGFKQKKEAQLAAAEFQKELSDDTYVDESNILFEDFAQEWLDLYQESVKIVEDIEQRNVVPKYLEKEELALFLKTAREKGIEDDYEFF